MEEKNKSEKDLDLGDSSSEESLSPEVIRRDQNREEAKMKVELLEVNKKKNPAEMLKSYQSKTHVMASDPGLIYVKDLSVLVKTKRT